MLWTFNSLLVTPNSGPAIAVCDGAGADAAALPVPHKWCLAAAGPATALPEALATLGFKGCLS